MLDQSRSRPRHAGDDGEEDDGPDSPLIDRSADGRPRAAPFVPPAGATLPSREEAGRGPGGEQPQGDGEGPGGREPEERGGHVSDSMESSDDDDEKELERVALLKRETDAQKNALLRRLELHVRDEAIRIRG